MLPCVWRLMRFSLASAASAQVTTATIVGTVTDSSGGALPGVTVTARNVDTGFTRTVPSNEVGAYRLEFLPDRPATSSRSALAGFKTASRSGIVLNVNDTVRVDVVAGDRRGHRDGDGRGRRRPLSTPTTSDISKTIDDAAIQSPAARRPQRLLAAGPDARRAVEQQRRGRARRSTTSSLSLGFPEQRTLINGGADGGTGSVNYYLDGGINMTALRNTGNILPNPDAIQEFKVQTNSYNAEYGRFASGIINVITKAGHQPLSAAPRSSTCATAT